MSNDASVSRWLDGLKAGDEANIQKLWDRYFAQLVRLAGAKLPNHAKRDYDEEDVALSAFHSFCDRVGKGQFPELNDRDDLWRLLSTITVRKVYATIRHQTRQKRGGGHVLGESAVMGPDDAGGFAQFLGNEPTPDVAVQFADDYERLFALLENDTLKTIARLKLEGHSSTEIAEQLKVSSRTVDRKLELIRALWEEDMQKQETSS